MKIPTTLILKSQQINKLCDSKKIIRVVERSFLDYHRNRAHMPPKVYLNLKKYNGDFRAMPAYLESIDAASLKWVNVHPDNKKKGLPTVMAIITLSDPKTGAPLSIMDGTLITKWRTAASSAIATKYLSNKSAETLSVLGCGAQALTQSKFLMQVRRIKKICLWDVNRSAANTVKRALLKEAVDVEVFKTVKECVVGADIITTITPSRKPLIKYEWIKPGVHINAIGADAAGKQELDSSIIKNEKVIIDDWMQASHSGEINVPLSNGVITQDDIYGDIGSIIAGKKKGRVGRNDITVFDSTGLAIQDTAVAHLIYKTAVQKKMGNAIQII